MSIVTSRWRLTRKRQQGGRGAQWTELASQKIDLKTRITHFLIFYLIGWLSLSIVSNNG